MSAGRDEGPVYYREIQKNAYLKRIPNENTSKLLPLGHKKPPLKPMWTLFCVHNGRTPFLEQYPEAESASTLAHKPVWRACLRSARHVTASVRPHTGTEYDFLVDTDHGPVRMLAPDWESMQDWVSTLRNKLHELKIVGKGENVYCCAPAPPPPRAAARDPTSPLPPTPPVPPDRVPGIELTSPLARTTQATQPTIPSQPTQTQPETEEPSPTQTETQQPTEPSSNIDISNWEAEDSTPSTSQETKIEPKKSVAKICGQNICIDDSILKRNLESRTDSDEEFFAEIDRLHESVENLVFDGEVDCDYKQRVVVNDEKEATADSAAESNQGERSSNITVIQVSNKPPHTAIPIVGPDTQVFNFDFQQNCPSDTQTNSFINIVNTEVNVQNSKESDYGHISLTTTVSLTGENKDKSEGIYERLCMASTSNEDKRSPLVSKKFDRIRNGEKIRKSSLPNLDISSTDSTYEYLFPNNNKNTTVTLNNEPQSLITTREVNSNITAISNTSQRNLEVNTSLTNGTRVNTVVTSNSGTVTNNVTSVTSSSDNMRPVHVNLCNSVSVGNTDLNSRVISASVERSNSQNTYDRMNRREIRTNSSPKRENKSDKTEIAHTKPIWKRGLTELSFLSRLRGLGQRQESPDRRPSHNDRVVTSPAKVTHRSRAAGRSAVDTARRRSSSLSNGDPPPHPPAPPPLATLRTRQAASLRADQRRGALATTINTRGDKPLLVDYNAQVWVAWWGAAGARVGGRAGDRVAALRGVTPAHAPHARQLLHSATHNTVDILFHRVPLAKIYVLTKRDMESIGIKLDSSCNITHIEARSPAARCLPPLPAPAPAWAVTEVNNRPLNLLKGGEEEMNRISLHGTEVSILIQPSALVKKIRQALKGNKSILSIR